MPPVLPDLSEGQRLESADTILKMGTTSPPSRFTEDTLLLAMERASAEDFAKLEDVGKGAPAQAQQSGLRGEKEGQRNGADARRQAGVAEWSLSRRGLGTPATRASMIEKLVRSGFAERKKKQLVPTEKGLALVWALPDQLKSAKLTAQWEERLGAVERGELSPDEFMGGITDMLTKLIKTYENVNVDHSSPLSQSGREVVGICPRCGKSVVEGKKSFFCEGYYDKPSCSFALWKNDRYFLNKRKEMTKSVAAALLKNGRIHMTGLYSEKKGVTYDATIIMEDTGEKLVRYKMEFGKKTAEKKGKN